MTAIHNWFGLTYSAYFTVPRSALQAMPEQWQERFVALMEEADEMGLETPVYVVQRRNERGRFMSDEWADYRHPKITHLLPEALRSGQ